MLAGLLRLLALRLSAGSSGTLSTVDWNQRWTCVALCVLMNSRVASSSSSNRVLASDSVPPTEWA